MKFDTQIVQVNYAGPVTAGSNQIAASATLDTKFKRCIGAKLISIDTGGLSTYNVKLQHNELSERDPQEYRDWNVANGNDYRNTFKPLDLTAAGSKIDIWVQNPISAISSGQTVRFQMVFLLTNEE